MREGNIAIIGNVLSDVQVNVHLKECRGVTFVGNTMWMAFEHNMKIEDCSHVIMSGNNMDRNPTYSYVNNDLNPVVIRNCNDCTIQGLHISNTKTAPAAVLFENCRRMNISNCSILDCEPVGLWLKDCSQCLVTGCLIQNDLPGSSSEPLKVTGGSGNKIELNLLGKADSK